MQDRVRHALAPTRPEIDGLPLSSNATIVSELLGHGGERALDIGCGDGKFTRSLARLFANVGGVDVKEKSIAAARQGATSAGLTIDFRVASGQELPYSDGHFDAVVFSNSLHHMPDPAIALREALRALRNGGLLYIMEPVPSGNYHEATRLVNDETEVRTEAYARLLELPGVVEEREIMYRARRTLADFEEWKADQIDRDARRKARFDAQPDRVRASFVEAADHEDGRLAFDQVFRVNLVRKSAA